MKDPHDTITRDILPLCDATAAPRTIPAHVIVDAIKRKALPLATGCIDFFPDALLAIAELSRIGSQQHNPGAPVRWDRSKSADEADAMMRHFIDRGTLDTDGVRHSTKVAWRALALLQKEIEGARKCAPE